MININFKKVYAFTVAAALAVTQMRFVNTNAELDPRKFEHVGVASHWGRSGLRAYINPGLIGEGGKESYRDSYQYLENWSEDDYGQADSYLTHFTPDERSLILPTFTETYVADALGGTELSLPYSRMIFKE